MTVAAVLVVCDTRRSNFADSLVGRQPSTSCHALSRSGTLVLSLGSWCLKEVPMSLVQRAFQGAVDWSAMLAVVQAQPSDHLHLIDLPYRLCSWAFDDP